MAARKADVIIASRIKRLAKRRRLTQTELARIMQIDPQSLYRALNGRRPIYAQEIRTLAWALGCRYADILGEEAQDAPED